MNIEHQYLQLMQELVDLSEVREPRTDRTGVGTWSVFGRQIRQDLSKGFPLLTTKKVYWKGVVGELLWFLRGDTNVKWLQYHDIHIWDEWADALGNLGPIYGAQWRNWNGDYIDQIRDIVEDIQKDPHSRRLVVSAWNPTEIPVMALAPCHCLFQFYVEDGKLSCQLYQRSADIFLGVPFNIASYALLTHIIAKCTGLEVGDFVHTFGDVHLYSNHIQQAKEQLTRGIGALPRLKINRDKIEFHHLHQLDIEDFDVVGYKPQSTIKAPVAV